jgi:hypothetical protein
VAGAAALVSAIQISGPFAVDLVEPDASPTSVSPARAVHQEVFQQAEPHVVIRICTS